ncbi:hypothetical protein SAMN05444149_1015 [Pseudosulfitobacter pseudonitzschiae]|uniref:Uncharacterized protein n=1 Tax=Pseudosulfitobacter pseudonitzschiae TaxID=1402135 RepID=A0A073J8Y0_9RHOB|nr:hypothetical protein [Pseudosulfitobacter pseudonitzschiae]KEJ98275.1 hypothetical protein SUH3_04585 [Pseudosulfitobacter pseudonitzschiae]SHE40338.1 hypothetical protein SAMN05444149_1015 [Pseudosulfitobacter pseudonitzschiae]
MRILENGRLTANATAGIRPELLNGVQKSALADTLARNGRLTHRDLAPVLEARRVCGVTNKTVTTDPAADAIAALSRALKTLGR